ncbi:MAG TPA: trehalase-like domain-containing protein, partial [Mycobacterium sp.]|nr:trehalase-like domain-containing protein [Mycobacterium sp.]
MPAAAAPPSTTDFGFGPHTLREYALLADGECGALIGPRGEVAWMCAPSWDDDAVFSSGTVIPEGAGPVNWLSTSGFAGFRPPCRQHRVRTGVKTQRPQRSEDER